MAFCYSHEERIPHRMEPMFPLPGSEEKFRMNHYRFRHRIEGSDVTLPQGRNVVFPKVVF